MVDEKKKTADVLQMFERPTLKEVQSVVKEWYESRPDVFLLMSAYKKENDDGSYYYDVAHRYYTCEGQDLLDMLENVMEFVKQEIKEGAL